MDKEYKDFINYMEKMYDDYYNQNNHHNEYSNNDSITAAKLIGLLENIDSYFIELNNFIKKINSLANKRLKERRYNEIVSKSKILSKIKSKKIVDYLYQKFYYNSEISEKYTIEYPILLNGFFLIDIYYERYSSSINSVSRKTGLVRHIESTEIDFYIDNYDQELISENYDDFKMLYELYERIYNIFQENTRVNYEEENIIVDGYFQLSIKLNGFGEFEYKIDIIDEKIKGKDTLTKNDYEIILHNFIINVDDLNGVTKRIVEKYFDEKIQKGSLSL